MGFANDGSRWRPERKRDEGNIIFATGLWTPAKSITTAKLPNGYRDQSQVNITSTIRRGCHSPVGTGEQDFPSGSQKADDSPRSLPALRRQDPPLDRPRLLFAAVPGTGLDRAPNRPRSLQIPSITHRLTSSPSPVLPEVSA